MEEEHCLRCYHYPVCYIHTEEARKQELWNRDNAGIDKFYTESAKSCDFYVPQKDIEGFFYKRY